MSSGSRGPGEDDGGCGLDKVNRGGTYKEWDCALPRTCPKVLFLIGILKEVGPLGAIPFHSPE